MEPFKPGDVNGDDEVNIGDLNIIIGIILGQQYEEGFMMRADVNQDGETNIGDVNTEIALILGGASK